MYRNVPYLVGRIQCLLRCGSDSNIVTDSGDCLLLGDLVYEIPLERAAHGDQRVVSSRQFKGHATVRYSMQIGAVSGYTGAEMGSKGGVEGRRSRWCLAL